MKDSKLKRKLVAIYEIFYEKRRLFILRTMYRLRIMDSKKTIKYIVSNNCSIARFGDGEFDLINKTRNPGFQEISCELSKELLNVLDNRNKNLLICIPSCFNSVNGCNDHATEFWIQWGKKNNNQINIVKMLRMHCGNNYKFGDTEMTRPYIDWISIKRAETIFPELKKIWHERDLIIIEGEHTCLGVGNDLFSNSKTIKRILTPAQNAFKFLDEIKECLLNIYNGELVLLALGPTATVLASHFSLIGIQALDIGHIDIEYEWFLRKATSRIAIPGKFTNEAKNGKTNLECKNQEYLKQIVARIGC